MAKWRGYLICLSGNGSALNRPVWWALWARSGTVLLVHPARAGWAHPSVHAGWRLRPAVGTRRLGPHVIWASGSGTGSRVLTTGRSRSRILAVGGSGSSILAIGRSRSGVLTIRRTPGAAILRRSLVVGARAALRVDGRSTGTAVRWWPGLHGAHR